MARSAATLAGGEAQRIRLASQIGSGLVGVLYILDEPSIGLEPRFIDMVFEILHDLQHSEGKTILMVEQNLKKTLEIAEVKGCLVGIHTGRPNAIAMESFEKGLIPELRA